MDRNQEIVRLRTAGVKLAEIGAQFGISKERVRQICAEAGADWLAPSSVRDARL